MHAEIAREKQRKTMILLSTEKTFFRGTDGYETARRATVWNGLLPDRFPDVIVQAHDTDDGGAAIRYARANGHHVGVRSGGHSWVASHLRDGGLLLDVSRLDHCTVAPDRRIADLGPGKSGCVFPPGIAKAFASVAISYRADTAGTVRCSGRHAKACLEWKSSPPTVNRSTATPKTIQTCIGRPPAPHR